MFPQQAFLFAMAIWRRHGPALRRSAVASLLAIAVLLTFVARAAIVVGSHSGAQGNLSQLSWSHTVASGSNRLLIVAVTQQNPDVNRVRDVSYNSVALTQITPSWLNGTQNEVTMWYLVAPAVGTASVVVSIRDGSNTLKAEKAIARAVNFTGVDQTDPIRHTTGNIGKDTAISVTVPGTSDDLVFGVAASKGDGDPLDSAAGQTEMWNLATGNAGGEVRSNGAWKAGASTVQMSWTLGASKEFSAQVVSLRAAGASVAWPAGLVVGTHTTPADASTASLSFSHTVPSGANRALVVVTGHNDGSRNVTGVSYGGVALTKAIQQDGASADTEASIWYLVNPNVGSANVVVTVSASVNIVASAVNLTGVNQTTPIGTAVGVAGNNSAPSVTVSSAANEVVIGAVGAKGDAKLATHEVGQTGIYNTDSGTGSGDIRLGVDFKPGASSASLQWTLQAAKSWAAVAVPFKPAPTYTIAGTVFEDLNYGGGAGRSLAASSGAGVGSATVELYDSSGAFIASSTTAAGGGYSFNVNGAATYSVRVVGSSVLSTRSGASSALLPVQTFRTNASSGSALAATDQVGGTDPSAVAPGAASVGAAFNTSSFVYTAGLTGTAQSVAQVSVGSANIAGVDFGFNFDTVVNLNDSGAGSLRQAITNANALGGDASLAQSGRTAALENLVFMISNGTAGSGLRSANNYFVSGVATIAPTSALPLLSTSLVIDAQTQPGWSANPILELNGNATGGMCLQLSAGSITLRGWVVNRCPGDAVNIAGGSNHVIQGNWIGTHSSGNAASAYGGSTSRGIALASTSGVLIGGTSATARNVISGNTAAGIASVSGTVSGVTVQGNYVGTNAAGSATIANSGDGIDVVVGSAIAIGGTAAGAGNVIAGNGGKGVNVRGTASGISILGNSIYANSSIGIDLNNDGVTANDGAKSAGTPNLLMDKPVITSASLSGTALIVAGYVGRAAGQSSFAASRVEIFVADTDASGYGEGQSYIGFVTADASGNFSGTLTVPGGVTLTAGSSKVTGTATDTSNNSSEFGANVTVLNLSLSGTVYEDLNYGGGAGRGLAASGAAPVNGATVELYNSSGTFVSSTTTAGGGIYTFSGLSASTSYFVRVAGPSVLSTRTGSSASLVGVLTWRANATSGSAVAVTDMVGGTNPALADPGAAGSGAAFNTSTFVYSAGLSGTAQAVTPITVANSSITGLDFGFNFDTVVNVNPSGQGSLRQFLLNANTLGGDASLAQSGLVAAKENAVFMISNGSAAAGLRAANNYFSGGVATIAPASALPIISAALVLDAQMQPGWSSAPIIELNGVALAAGNNGLAITAGASTVRGFIINRFVASTGHAAIALSGAGGNTLQGNYLGTDAAGNVSSPNYQGIRIDACNANLIGGTTAAQRNLISGNQWRGVYLVNGASGNLIRGNHIGSNAAGTAALANQVIGIYFNQSGSNTVGGVGAGEGNVISGNTQIGIYLVYPTASANLIQGNTIGLNAARSAALPNGVSGIELCCAGNAPTNNTIGGAAAGAGNFISGNTSYGIRLFEGSGNTIQANTISGNGVDGIQIRAGTGNAILANSIFGNGALGIDLGSDNAVTPNNGSKSAALPNFEMDFAVFTSARSRGNQLTVAGYVGSAAGQSSFGGSRVEIFLSDNAASGYGQGKTYLGMLTADASGNFSGTLTMPLASLALGSKLTGTATDGSNNSSEFGAQFALAVDLVVNSNLDEADISAGDGSCLTASGVCTLRAAIAEVNAWATLPVTPTIAFAIPGCTAYGAAGCSITPATALPSITRAVIIDATTQTGWNAGSFAPMIELNGSVAPAATGGLVLAADNSSLRGLVVNRFNGAGITLSGNANTLAGNWIGTNAAGTAAAGNTGAAGYGVRITGSNNLVGGVTSADRNVISGNAAAGVYVAGGSGNALRGNTLGLDANDSSALANSAGIFVAGGSNTAIGGISASQANLISGNAKGVVITSGSGHSVQRNRIFSNSSIGIDLGNDGATANDGATSAGQPNLLMDSPVITGAGIDPTGTSMTVFGYIGTGSGQAAFAGARVEFFKALPDSTGRGQGQTYLGALVADAAGQFNGAISFASGAIVVGDVLSATATDGAGNSSEFGANWTTTTEAGLTPSGFNAFESDTAAGATSGVIRSHLAGAAITLDVIALASSGVGLHPGFTGNVTLTWIDARDDSGAFSGSCRASWTNVAAAGTAVFSTASRVGVALTPPATSTRVMRLKMSYVDAGGSVTACSNDAFAAIPSTLTLVASDADAASVGTARTLSNLAASGGVVHKAGRPFTVTSQARDATGTLMTAYDGTPTLAVASCILPAGCSAGALNQVSTSASAGIYTNTSVSYSEVGAVALQLTDSSYASVDSADTAAAVRTFASAAVGVGRFVPDSFTATVSTPGQFATANGTCMASGTGSIFIGQGFGWAIAPQVTLTARNAAGATTTYWAGTLMKLVAGSGNLPSLVVGAAGSATLSSSFGSVAVAGLGSGQARLTASSSDRFVLELPAGSVQPSVTPSWTWALAVTDASEAGTIGNPTLAVTGTQGGVAFDLGGVFHSARLSLSPSHGDARSGVRVLVQLLRYTAAGWVTMTEDRGCITLQPQNLGVESPVGIFISAGVCAAPMPAGVTTAGGRVWIALPATPGAAPGRLTLRLAGAAASGNSCTPAGATQPIVPMALPYLLGGAASAGPAALATWGAPNRDAVLRRETW